MNLSEYDNKLIRIIDSHNNIFEGVGVYNDENYNETEYGKKEESIQILYYNFYKRHIYKIEEIDSYSAPYGFLEEMILQDGISFIEDLFEEEDTDVLIRLLNCIENNIQNISYKNKLLEFLRKELKNNNNQKIQKAIQRVLSKSA